MEVIEKISSPIFVKRVRSLLGHAEFYRIFIKDFSKIFWPMCILMEKEMKFEFDEKCVKAFVVLKNKLIEALILTSLNWELRFESDVAVGAMLAQRKEKVFHLMPCKQNIGCSVNQLHFDKKRNDRLGICF